MRLAALARGGAGRASLTGGETRSARDWDLLKDAETAAKEKGRHVHSIFVGTVRQRSVAFLFPPEP